MTSKKILTLETSCDETAAAIVTDSLEILGEVVASQDELHRRFGGVVPEIASRAHVERILPVIDETLRKAGVTLDDIDAVAVANTPGLAGSLLVGLVAAKAICAAKNIPLIAVNHLQAHLYACRLAAGVEVFPCVGLIVSGGHSNLYHCRGPLDFELLGATIDDAAGEAFDKVATILKLPYPGGPNIERIGRKGDPKAISFPRSMLEPGSLDFSFSGLKTAVLYHCRGQDMTGQDQVDSMTEQQIADIAASFQAAVIDVLVKKTKRAAERIGARTILMGGGVAANGTLREAMQQMADKGRPPRRLLVAPKQYCTDNAVMVASLAYYKYQAKLFAPLTLEPSSTG